MRRSALSVPDAEYALPKSAHVLVLDDQRFDRHRLARLCSGLEMKCQITNAKTLVDFAAILDTDTFDLVLLDYGLPDGTGFDALEIARLSPENCNAAMIMVSGQGQEILAQDAIKAGCGDYITKDDLTPTSFRRAVTNAMQKSVLTVAVHAQTFRSSETEAVLEKFATQCAQDIKPMVSRMMRQLRDLRSSGMANDAAQSPLSEVEASCMLLWDFLVQLESYQAVEDGKDMVGIATQKQDFVTTKPPSPFARRSNPLT